MPQNAASPQSWLPNSLYVQTGVGLLKCLATSQDLDRVTAVNASVLGQYSGQTSQEKGTFGSISCLLRDDYQQSLLDDTYQAEASFLSRVERALSFEPACVHYASPGISTQTLESIGMSARLSISVP